MHKITLSGQDALEDFFFFVRKRRIASLLIGPIQAQIVRRLNMKDF